MNLAHLANPHFHPRPSLNQIPHDLVYAIGDIHGSLVLFKQLMEKIFKDAGPRPFTLVLLGDYSSRGPDSKGVMDYILELQKTLGNRGFILRGNHEERVRMIIEERMSPPNFHKAISEWGMDKTLESYGVNPNLHRRSSRSILSEFQRAMPAEHRHLLQTIPCSLETRHAFFCHGGIDYALPLDQQKIHSLVYGQNDLPDHAPAYAKHVVHGHKRQKSGLPHIHGMNINVDTAAEKTGVLTACVIEDGNIRFLSTKHAIAPCYSTPLSHVA